MDFELKWVTDKKESLQVVAEQYLLECSEKNNNTFGENTDVESFLRGYRRWKNDPKNKNIIKNYLGIECDSYRLNRAFSNHIQV
ncbi:hypothetical protein Q4540_13010 [Pseudoalteromonas carrageenovora]|uniref:hypothetical protein n=1 Tax=Pseudoalteromonas carrageenovora TaxID=227 RepID=UPI0026E3759C|nr:hypothetical protein [Pseudoalteromonas carrageenovora]MDO6637264.1 hypothetical protein [Pseudoalteromonas carrageenovora]MDO6649415.1 hypothetical protein [Pseudoalteromonas carrageenovora]